MTFQALILAGDRGPGDPLCQATGVSHKALVPVAGVPTVLRVLTTLERSPMIDSRLLVGPPAAAVAITPELQRLIDGGDVTWLPPLDSPSRSAALGLTQLDVKRPILLTTADHALLTPEVVAYFCEHAQASAADVVVGLVPYPLIQAEQPGMRRTVIRLGAGFCGCNLFAFLSAEGQRAATFWQQVEQDRKRPHRLLGVLGWGTVLRYAVGHLSLESALERLSQQLSLRIAAVLMPFPLAAVDVDSVADWHFAEREATRRPD